MLMNGIYAFGSKSEWMNLLFIANVAVSEVSLIYMPVEGQEGLFQHWKGTVQSSPFSGCRAHTTDRTAPTLLRQPAMQHSHRT